MAASLNPFLSPPDARIQLDVGTVPLARITSHPGMTRYRRGRLGCDSGAPPGANWTLRERVAGPPTGGPGT